MPVSFVDVCRFTPTLGGTTDWIYSTAVTGYQSPAAAGAIDGATYRYRAESADLSQWEVGYGTYTVSSTTLTRTGILYNSSGGTSKINFSTVPQVAVVLLAEDLPKSSPGIQNATIVVSGTTSSTRTIKTLNGSDPSPNDPVILRFSDGTAYTLTTATSLTIPSTGTVGTVGGIPFALWDCLIYDAGTIRLGVRKCSDANGIYGFPAGGLLSSTIVTTPNSVGVTYTNAAVASKPYLLLGHSAYEAGQAVAGTWATAPSPYVIYVPGAPKPGDPTGNSVQFLTTALSSNTTAAYVDTALTATITPNSAANLVHTYWDGVAQLTLASIKAYISLRRSGSIIGVPKSMYSATTNLTVEYSGSWMDAPGSAGALTYTVATILSSTAGSPTIFFGNTDTGATITLTEIMG